MDQTNEALEALLAELPDDPAARKELLLRLLGPAAARQLGIYRLPDGFVLSVVIPIYNERNTVLEVVRRVLARSSAATISVGDIFETVDMIITVVGSSAGIRPDRR